MVRRDFVRLATFVSIVATCPPARADPFIQIQPNAASYMIFYDRLRGFRTLQLGAEGLRDQAIEQSAFDEANYKRNLRLYPQGAVDRETLEISDMRRQVSTLSIERYNHDALTNAAEVAANGALMPYVQGQPVDIAVVYTHFKRVWDEQCAARRVRVDEATAIQTLTNYRLARAARLVGLNAISLEEYEQRLTEQLQAAANLRTSQALLDTCHELEPTMSFITTLATPPPATPVSPTP